MKHQLDGSPPTTYRIDENGCSCEGFRFRQKCSHTSMWKQGIEGDPVSFESAFAAVEEMRKRCEFSNPSFTKDPSGEKVIEVKVTSKESEYKNRTIKHLLRTPEGNLVTIIDGGGVYTKREDMEF